jgi:hypothetical protein
MNINDKRYRDPKLISEYLPFVKQISQFYQRPSGEVVIIDKNKYYFIRFSSFQLKHSRNVYELGVPSHKKIQTIFNSYTGRTFIFYNYYYIQAV